MLDGDSSLDLAAETNPSVRFQQQVYSTGGLDPTAQHTLAINLLDPGPFTLDFLRIGAGQSNSATQVPSPSPTSKTITSGTSATRATIPHKVDAATSSVSSVGDSSSITSSSTAVPSDSIASPSPSITFPSSLTPTTSTIPVGAGASPSPSPSQNSSPVSPGITSVSTPTSSSGFPMSEDNSSGPDAVVIGSVAGAIVFFAIVVISALLFLRRRRKMATSHTYSAPASKLSGTRNDQPRRPRLQLSIPSSLSLPRALQRPALLPIHSSKSTPTPVKPTDPFGSTRPTPAFLAEDPNDSPVFDIKQRPVSGSTVTTRVTVGTTIGQRFSVPDSVYRYPNSEAPVPVPVPVPPIPILQSGESALPSPTETGASSTPGSPSRFGFGFGITANGTNQGGTVDTSVYSGHSENGLAPNASANSVSRPLPHIPGDAKRPQARADHAGDGFVPKPEIYSYGHRLPPATPSEAETFVHQDAGVRLASGLHTQPRRELPPPYQDYGI